MSAFALTMTTAPSARASNSIVMALTACVFDIEQASELKRLAVYFDVHTQLWEPPKPWAEMGRQDWDALFLPGIADGDGGQGSDGTSSAAEGRTYVLKPVDGRLNYIRRGRNVRKDESQPIQEADVSLHAVSLHISSELFPICFPVGWA